MYWEFSLRGSLKAFDPLPFAFLEEASGRFLPPGLARVARDLDSSAVTLGKSFPFSESQFLEL